MMRLPPRSWRLLAWSLAGAAAGWFLVPPSAHEPAAAVSVRTPWVLEPLPARPGNFAMVMAGRAVNGGFWGTSEEPPPVAAPPENLSWRVAAIVGAGAQRRLLVVYRAGTRPNQMVGLKEALPSGHRVTEIGDVFYCVDINGRTYRLGVERSE